ncbi:MAG: SurA N-terminal domain-containing protein [Alteripontixanthobacter sp.]
MITAFRRFFQSKFGIVATLGFVALIGLAFAMMDVSGSPIMGGVAGGERVAVVGDEKIGTADLSRAVTNAYDRAREQDPTLSIQAFLANEGMEGTLQGLIDRTAIAEYAEMMGLRAGDNLVNSEIQRIPGFRGPDGNFSTEAYQAALRQNGLNDATFRADARQGLLAQQMLIPASLGAQIPGKLARQYAALLKERREGSIGLIPSAVFMPEGEPSDAQLTKYFEANRDDYIRPERRVLRYASFGTEALDGQIEPTDAEIAARFKRDAANYAASETRNLTQLIVPTEAAARSIRQRVQSGGSLAAAAREAGFETTQLSGVTREALASQASAQVAQAAFSAERGELANVARSGLGWHVLRVDTIERVPARTLAQVRGDIATALREEKRRLAINDLAAGIEEQVDDGVALSELAQELGVKVQSTRPLLATGQVYETRETAPQILAPVLANAFEMPEGEPQLSEVVRGETFLIYEVSTITPSATAPLTEIAERVERDWRRAQGQAGARKAADAILAKVASGTSLTAAMRSENSQLSAVRPVALSREELAARGAQVEPPLALMFSMAQDTAKKLEARDNAGWYVVALDEIEVGEVAEDDPILAGVTGQLSQTQGQEFIDQLRRAMRAEVGVESNEVAIEAVARSLRGEQQ